MGAEPQTAENAAIEVADNEGLEDGTFSLSSGVILQAKQAPMKVVMGVMAKFEKPKPPTMFDPGLGRDVENYEDPTYKKEVSRIDTLTTEAVMNVLIIFGTEIVEVPKGISKPKDNEWLDKLEATGVEISEKDKANKHWRYLNWFATVAAPLAQDMVALMNNVGRLTGVSEGDVADAATFPESN